ncbi:MAG: GyrI-like domain-containing protein [Planctomycetota bacterium]
MKINLVKELKEEFSTAKKCKLLDVSDAQYLAVDGKGSPGEDAFADAVGALYGMAYTIKFACKDRDEDFVVGKLEALYAKGVPMEEYVARPKEEWEWTMMIRMPEVVTEADMEPAREALRKKGKTEDFGAVRLEAIEEGRCVQMLHLGPYEEEAVTGAAMIAFCEEQGVRPHRWHHEIYMSDPRRVPAEKLNTLLRFPVVDA